ncbi:MAG: DUF692 family protein, partial [Betaproteobacteria bacterium]|nr:DUF692 family protein [Betaproteobacteria bacterium]
MAKADFLSCVAGHCRLRHPAHFNNISVNPQESRASWHCRPSHSFQRIASATCVAGHGFDERFGLFIDIHSQPVRPRSPRAGDWARQHCKDILLEWDNDIPDLATINRELACLRAFYDYVRGRCDTLPAGYGEPGMFAPTATLFSGRFAAAVRTLPGLARKLVRRRSGTFSLPPSSVIQPGIRTTLVIWQQASLTIW